jgi:peptidoglycan/LPS O-acetylase OafA/YrhL
VARFPCFDGLRAFAALTVIGVHTSFASGLDGRSQLGRYASRLEIGVAVFFVISGFLLYRPFATAHFLGDAATPMKKFWARRLRRIIPAYWAAFIVITYVLHADTVRRGWGSLAMYLGFAQIYSPNHVLTGITQAWSLCTEMSFYVLLPLWAVLVGRRRRSAGDQLRVELAGLAILVLTSFAFRTWVLQWHTSVATTMPDWLPAYTDLFALGMLLAVVSSYLGATDQRPSWLWHPGLPWASWALAGLAFWAVSNIGLPVTPLTPSSVGPSLLRQTLYGVFAFLVVLPAVFGPQDQGWGRRLLQLRPVMLIGVASYGIYLWHQAGMVLFFRWTGDRLFSVPFWELTTAVTGMAVLAAVTSYVVVERPIWRGRTPGTRPAALRRPLRVGPKASSSAAMFRPGPGTTAATTTTATATALARHAPYTPAATTAAASVMARL